MKTDFQMVDSEVLGVPGASPFPAGPSYGDATGAEAAPGLDLGPAQVPQARATTPTMEIRVARGLDGLLPLEAEWRSLAASLPEQGFMHAFGWQLAYLQHLEPNPESLHFFSFYADGRLVAIFPLRHRRRVVFGIPLRFWELPAHPHLVLGDVLIAPNQDGGALLRQLVQCLGEQKELPWDVLHLPDILEESCALRSLRAASLARTIYAPGWVSMYFPCPDMETALATTKKEYRRNLRRQRKKLADNGALTMSVATEGTELDIAFAEFLRLEASGWKGKVGKGSAILLHPKLYRFYSTLKDQFSADTRCLIFLLRLDGVAIAAQFCLLAGHTLYLSKIAYDETWQAGAPGNQLLYDVLEYCCARDDIHRFSLVTGPLWAVPNWHPPSTRLWDVCVVRASLPGLLYYTARRCKTHLLVPARKALQRVRSGLGRLAGARGGVQK
ncbi:MAG TPA: GNAT family N-acetyltransferase [Azospira sp.]|nr:GNAT family N-acetyltransferase [Azospira sp.]